MKTRKYNRLPKKYLPVSDMNDWREHLQEYGYRSHIIRWVDGGYCYYIYTTIIPGDCDKVYRVTMDEDVQLVCENLIDAPLDRYAAIIKNLTPYIVTDPIK